MKPASLSAAELQHAVSVNEAIKLVIGAAFQVNLMGLNALILARRAGDKARGFGVLSDELRQLTRELSQVMSRLQDLTRQSVSCVTQRAKQDRIQRVLARCQAIPGTCARLAGAPLVRLSGSIDATSARLHQLKRQLVETVEDSQRIGTMANVIVRTARIEAAYGDDFRIELTAVSDEFASAIEGILANLEKLRQRAGSRLTVREPPPRGGDFSGIREHEGLPSRSLQS